LSDCQIVDALFLSSKTAQAQNGLKNSMIQDILYHGTDMKFEEFRLKSEGLSKKQGKDIVGIYVAPNKRYAKFY
jgi:hypothetical protein